MLEFICKRFAFDVIGRRRVRRMRRVGVTVRRRRGGGERTSQGVESLYGEVRIVVVGRRGMRRGIVVGMGLVVSLSGGERERGRGRRRGRRRRKDKKALVLFLERFSVIVFFVIV